MTTNFNNYVHEHNGRYIVALRREDGRYEAPQRREVATRTGCHSIYGTLAYVAGNAYNYARRADALRKARELFVTE